MSFMAAGGMCALDKRHNHIEMWQTTGEPKARKRTLPHTCRRHTLSTQFNSFSHSISQLIPSELHSFRVRLELHSFRRNFIRSLATNTTATTNEQRTTIERWSQGTGVPASANGFCMPNLVHANHDGRRNAHTGQETAKHAFIH